MTSSDFFALVASAFAAAGSRLSVAGSAFRSAAAESERATYAYTLRATPGAATPYAFGNSGKTELRFTNGDAYAVTLADEGFGGATEGAPVVLVEIYAGNFADLSAATDYRSRVGAALLATGLFKAGVFVALSLFRDNDERVTVSTESKGFGPVRRRALDFAVSAVRVGPTLAEIIGDAALTPTEDEPEESPLPPSITFSLAVRPGFATAEEREEIREAFAANYDLDGGSVFAEIEESEEYEEPFSIVSVSTDGDYAEDTALYSYGILVAEGEADILASFSGVDFADIYADIFSGEPEKVADVLAAIRGEEPKSSDAALTPTDEDARLLGGRNSRG